MKSHLINLLESMGYPVYLQGSLLESEYPDSFFTVWDFEADELIHYNGDPFSCTWGFWVYFYSTSPELVESEPLKAKLLLTNNGYSVDGKPTSANSGTRTHTGSMLTARYLEIY